MENDPRAVFERLFGGSDSTDAGRAARRGCRRSSILDSVADKIAGLQRRLGARDAPSSTEYLEAIRDIERRIQKAEEQSARELPVVEQPAGIPAPSRTTPG